MKKLTSVVLSVLMVISMLSCLFTGSVSAAAGTGSTGPTNMITNGDFESYDGINNANNNSTIPALAWRSIVTSFPTDKTNGQWYRSTGGHSSSTSPDLNAKKVQLTADELKTTYPTYFGPNNQMVVEPGNNENHVLRIVQDCYTQIDEPKDGGKYTLTFKFRLPSAETSLTSIDLSCISPVINEANGQSKQNELRYPFNITSAKIVDDGTTVPVASCTIGKGDAKIGSADQGYDYQYLHITLDSPDSKDWYTVKVTFTTEAATHDNAQRMTYTKDGNTYTSPIALKLSYGPYSPGNVTSSIAGSAHTKTALYLDDFTMYENVNCFGDAEFLDVNGDELANEQAYVGIKTIVDGKDTSEIYEGQTVNATVDYDKTSGAYTFLGWYKDDVLYDKAETITFTATPGETYTPHFGSVNLLGDSGSFENIASETHLRMDTPTTDNPNFPTGNKWGFNVNAGYFGKTWKETIYDKDGISYQQTSDGSIRTDRLGNETCNVLDDASIAKSGSKFLHINEGVPVSLGIDNLDANTDYELSFYLRYKTDTNKIKAIGITTTVNISNATLDKTSFENAVVNPNHKIVFASCDNNQLSKVSTTDWQKISISFNSKNFEKLYLAVVSSGSAGLDYYIDDIVLVKMTSADVQFLNTKGEDITENYKHEVKPTISETKPGYLVAKANYEDGAYDFRGWYDGNTFVSADKEFEFANGKYSTLTAKVVSRNILSSTASFESYEVNSTTTYEVPYTDTTTIPDYPSGNLWGTSANKGYYNATYAGTIKDNTGREYTQSNSNTQGTTKIKAAVSDAQYKSGSKSLRIDFYWRAASLGIEVTPNTDYTLSYYWYTDKGQNIFEKLDKEQLKSAVVTTLNVGESSTANANDDSGKTIIGAFPNFLHDSNSPITLGAASSADRTTTGGEWKKVTISFNSGDLSTVYLVLSPGVYNKTENGQTDNRALGYVWIDDLTCYANNMTAANLGRENITEYKASNMRSGNVAIKQALRHQFAIENDFINNFNSELYGSVVEYGSIAIPTSYLDRQELVKDGTYNGKSPAEGVAYQKDADGEVVINKIFAKEGTTITFTAALTGIGTNNYDRSYTVRNYVILKKGNKETVVYGAEVAISVFDVMAAILGEYKDCIDKSITPKTQLEADYNTVKSILNNDINVKTAFLDSYPKYEELLKK